MKRILLLSLVLLTISALPAMAEKYDWTDPAYDFTKVQRILVNDVDTSAAELRSPIIEKVLKTDFRTKAAKLPRTLIDPALAPKKITSPVVPPKQEPPAANEVVLTTSPKPVPSPQQEAANYNAAMAAITDIYVDAALLTYHRDSAFVPAHTEWQSDYRDYTWYDRHGHPHLDSYVYDYPVYVPDHYIPIASVQMRFNVYDAKTGKPVFSREETRLRGSSSDMRGVYNRIIDAFYKTLKNKLTGE